MLLHGLTRRIERLERECAAQDKYVLFPLSDHPETVVRLPRRFVEWLADKGAEHCSGGRYFNLTDQRWEEC